MSFSNPKWDIITAAATTLWEKKKTHNSTEFGHIEHVKHDEVPFDVKKYATLN